MNETQELRANGITNGSGSISPTLVGFAFGAVVGAGIALLFAPEPGKKMRERLATTAQRVGKSAAELSIEAKSAIQAGRDAFVKDRNAHAEERMAAAPIGSSRS